ncbi:monomeric isocitrate dehydrogenase [Parabacteroides sp. PF5-5]|uniref:DUF4468 domain-containing protein n=1 Tax=unclassified Parabacteroides TaxID=2649774 RepID=UPI0024746E9A|nr:MULTISPECIES: DUF4468 domain-containing protein [unclassified Parabacteroides]MDH6304970.1 monomeric isocitrate dehydrogenase [Parabacteroides sp. PH5-39]MDH6315944.1 monomeric isocitrate dehydrogenase [Parabacteroides sp. PF5-13]MDH6319601.1 monomeric isocitrate dehydrogenase [Parabacteroides sp. PH5-13]MDH6323332.1 monomeric isocitrate dehydrogenase [Parabacteroides sp. PH5-8]MDH6327159.1 monomeric isocitrate dehydrogenase [Parabacteroides sp. PH5-41]
MKKHLLLILCFFSCVSAMSQGHKGTTKDCAPMKRGKVCYTDTVEAPGLAKEALFKAIDAWARKNYGKDVFMSNVSSNASKSSILVSSKVELLMDDSTKTLLRYKMYVTCHNEGYTAEVRDIRYQYDAEGDKRFKTYTAEEVIADNGLSNTAASIKDPVLFCNATYFFVESLFADLYAALKEE